MRQKTTFLLAGLALLICFLVDANAKEINKPNLLDQALDLVQDDLLKDDTKENTSVLDDQFDIGDAPKKPNNFKKHPQQQKKLQQDQQDQHELEQELEQDREQGQEQEQGQGQEQEEKAKKEEPSLKEKVSEAIEKVMEKVAEKPVEAAKGVVEVVKDAKEISKDLLKKGQQPLNHLLEEVGLPHQDDEQEDEDEDDEQEDDVNGEDLLLENVRDRTYEQEQKKGTKKFYKQKTQDENEDAEEEEEDGENDDVYDDESDEELYASDVENLVEAELEKEERYLGDAAYYDQETYQDDSSESDLESSNLEDDYEDEVEEEEEEFEVGEQGDLLDDERLQTVAADSSTRTSTGMLSLLYAVSIGLVLVIFVAFVLLFFPRLRLVLGSLVSEQKSRKRTL